MFWENFWPNFIANLIADGLIVGLGLFVLSRFFEKKDEAQKEAKQEKRRKENLRIAVNMIWVEIEDNRKQLNLLIGSLSKRPRPDIIYPALSTSAWKTVDHQQIIDGINLKDFANLLKIYNRIYTINKSYYKMLDKIEWILLGNDSTVRSDYIDAIIDRSNELLEFIDEVFPIKMLTNKTK